MPVRKRHVWKLGQLGFVSGQEVECMEIFYDRWMIVRNVVTQERIMIQPVMIVPKQIRNKNGTYTTEIVRDTQASPDVPAGNEDRNVSGLRAS